MKASLVLLIILVSFSFGCGYGSNYNSNTGGMTGAMANIAAMVPSSASAGSPGFTMTVNGTNFAVNSVVYFNGTAQSTMYITANQLMATIPAVSDRNCRNQTCLCELGRKYLRCKLQHGDFHCELTKATYSLRAPPKT